jgi:Flp pilus assembly protein TadD
MGRKGFKAALEIVAEARARFPADPLLCRIQGYALLQEGRDRAGAEQALRELIALEPGDAEARRNLHMLLGGGPSGPSGV